MAGEEYSRSAITKVLVELMADIMEIDPKRISEHSNLVNDLEADSLALLQFADGIEAHFANLVRLEDTALERIKTIRDAVDAVFYGLNPGAE